MAKNKKHKIKSNTGCVEHHRGEIQDNALKALVTSQLFRSKVEKAKKGKGSFQRKQKHKGQTDANRSGLFIETCLSLAT
ncbi:ribosome alternative rescue factor ArfA [Vibrio sp. Of7-15]|uniref:ribosome alternative rescue factor ArfA n=1 Tax=Vibrio sp. Of7-15 TaxID=2724879 RepID=UPI001EF30969|nr:ribosome alternative rescue factor ArfA [Vibrio sp. Of7-15]MCG7496474.1 ribosome alternative rescue factor ArfA [Vibrio sp. Of7-15]